MKLTKETLYSLIREVRREKRKNSMILTEVASDSPLYDKIVNILEGNAGVQTVAIMSGQYPMARDNISSAENAARAVKLRARLREIGAEFDEVGGVFSGLDEESVVIYNQDRNLIEELNREFEQWGFVWGENLPHYQMMVIDYDSEKGHAPDPSSQVATQVLRHEQVEQVENNYTYDKVSNKKFIIPVYGVPPKAVI
jgi:hypothetical protein